MTLPFSCRAREVTVITDTLIVFVTYLLTYTTCNSRAICKVSARVRRVGEYCLARRHAARCRSVYVSVMSRALYTGGGTTEALTRLPPQNLSL